MWKQFIIDYLNFSKKERTGITVLIILVAVFILLPLFYPYFIPEKIHDHTAFANEITLLKMKEADSSGFADDFYKPYSKYADHKTAFQDDNYTAKFEGELFNFDPNTASAADWKRLGLKDKTIATIQKYVSKGGKFYKREDIGKIWGLHPNEVKRLMPFVQIKGILSNYYINNKAYETRLYEKPKYTPAIIDVNDSDTSALVALPGIGSKLSQRIVNFRDKLGGFYKVEQVGETFGLPDSTFQKIKARLKIENSNIRQININTATLDELKMHPYLRYAIANAIVQYRTQHGNFQAVSDIKKIMLITDENFNKVMPYLKVN